MKKLILAAALSVITCNIYAQQPAPTPPVKAAVKVDDKKAPKFQFTETSHDFGNIPEGPAVTHYFTYKNVGKSPLIIQSANAECGCTTPEFDKEPVLPGKTAKIKVTYNTQGRVGPFSKKVWVTSNSIGGDAQGRHELQIKGNVEKK